MLFSEYISILKAHFCKSISNEEIFGILFDAVIVPLDLRNKKGDPFFFDKVAISRIMTNKQNVPRQIRDNIYEPAVLSELVAYFEDNIVSELVPKTDDLCFQMMETLRADRMISPQHLAEFQMLATPSSVGAFLAEMFVYVVMADIRTDRMPVSERAASAVAGEDRIRPKLVLRGVREGRLSSFGIVEELMSRPGMPFEAQQNRVADLFDEAMGLHPAKANMPFSFSIYSPIKIGESEQELLETIAEHLDLTLPADFFDLGDLERDGISSTILGEAGMRGSSEARQKYRAIHGILETLEEMAKASPFMSAFKETACLALAIENEGTAFDEDVRVQISIPKKSVLSFTDMLEFDEGALEYIAYDCDFDEVFGIKRGADFLAYGSSRKSSHPVKLPPQRLPGFLCDKNPNYYHIIPTLFEFDMVESDTDWQIEVVFDEVLQHTAVAFPELVLLKDSLSEIGYSIRSKYMPHVVSGYLRIREGPENGSFSGVLPSLG